ncbi:MAG: hypothetical protein K6F56_07760 [Oscillospiraceae bacterium]|nr:hypothetical protein [Oscillospiraceae bacterium]
MGGINKQKFLTELGRLLTFMYEDDRERALAMYSSLFDETGDETGLLQMLVSPTRQAVNLARSYDARERKLQAQAQARGEAQGEDEPSFVRVIEQLRVQAASLGAPVSKVSADQFSLFESAGKETALFEEFESQDAPVQESAPAQEDFAAPAEPSDASLSQSSGDGEIAQDAAPAEEASAIDAFLQAPEEESEGSVPDAPLPPLGYEDESARSDFGFASEAAAPADEVSAPAPVQAEALHSEIRAGERPVFTVSKPRVALLILFLLFAVPITLACIVLLLLPAALALGVAGLAGWLGFTGLTATFGSFTVFADILLVFGCTLIVLALALLFLWIFIWLLGGAIPGLIRGVSALAHKWCYKEVPLQ